MLHRLIRYSCIYAVRMSPTLNESSALQCFERGNVVEICNRIMLYFYSGLPHIHWTCWWSDTFITETHEPSLVPTLSKFPLSRFWSLAVCKNRGGRFGPFYHMNDILSTKVEGGEGSPIERTHLAHPFFVLKQGWYVFHFTNVWNSSA